jgi:hypothetical protein
MLATVAISITVRNCLAIGVNELRTRNIVINKEDNNNPCTGIPSLLHLENILGNNPSSAAAIAI